MEKFSDRNFQPAPLCLATTAPNEKGKKAQRASHREGAGPCESWQSWLPQPEHAYTSEMPDIPSRIKYV